MEGDFPYAFHSSLSWGQKNPVVWFSAIFEQQTSYSLSWTVSFIVFVLNSTIHAQPYNDLPFKGISIFAFIQIILFFLLIFWGFSLYLKI